MATTLRRPLPIAARVERLQAEARQRAAAVDLVIVDLTPILVAAWDWIGGLL